MFAGLGLAKGAVKTILVVVGDPQLRDWLVRSLSGADLRTIATPDGRDVLFQFVLDPPDLMILDINLPGQDALETLRRVRKLSNVPIVVLSGHNESASIESLAHGADCFMPRPLGLRELDARVHALLRRAEGRVRRPAPSRLPAT